MCIRDSRGIDQVDRLLEYHGFIHSVWAGSFHPCILLLERKEYLDPTVCAYNADHTGDGLLRLKPGIMFALARVDRPFQPKLCRVRVG